MKMIATGIVRRIDDLGRVVIPKEVRQKLRIKEGDPLELWVDGDTICFKKYNAVPQFEDNLMAVVDMLGDESVCQKISEEDRNLVSSIAKMLLKKWKEGEQND